MASTLYHDGLTRCTVWRMELHEKEVLLDCHTYICKVEYTLDLFDWINVSGSGAQTMYNRIQSSACAIFHNNKWDRWELLYDSYMTNRREQIDEYYIKPIGFVSKNDFQFQESWISQMWKLQLDSNNLYYIISSSSAWNIFIFFLDGICLFTFNGFDIREQEYSDYMLLRVWKSSGVSVKFLNYHEKIVNITNPGAG